jgi:hypothetical protein
MHPIEDCAAEMLDTADASAVAGVQQPDVSVAQRLAAALPDIIDLLESNKNDAAAPYHHSLTHSKLDMFTTSFTNIVISEADHHNAAAQQDHDAAGRAYCFQSPLIMTLISRLSEIVRTSVAR